MAAGTCQDTFVIMILSDVDCHLEITDDSHTFELEPGNEQAIVVPFEYYVGTGYNASHSNFGFSVALDALSTGNAASMSFSTGVFNPPSPDITGTPRELKNGTLTIVAAATSVIDPAAANQNIGGTITMNTGV